MMFRASLSPLLLAEILCVGIYIYYNGFLNYLGEVFLSGLVGVALMLFGGASTLFSRFGTLGLRDAFGSLGLALGGFLLALPGILSDFCGVFVVIIALFLKIFAIFGGGREESFKFENRPRQNDDFIDVEIISEEKK